MRNGLRSLVMVAVGVLLGGAATAADPAPSTITIPDLDCASCAKKVGKSIVEVPGVAKAEYDVKAKVVRVTPKAGHAPSPKALWEAVEKADKTPSKLEGPGGTFTAKPTN